MSRQRKTAAVLRLLRGEDLETVSRGLGVTAATLSGWRDAFLAAGEAANSGDHPALLFSFSDAPVMKALSLYRHEARP